MFLNSVSYVFVDFSEESRDGTEHMTEDDDGECVRYNDTKKQQIRIKLDEIISIGCFLAQTFSPPSCTICDN